MFVCILFMFLFLQIKIFTSAQTTQHTCKTSQIITVSKYAMDCKHNVKTKQKKVKLNWTKKPIHDI